jgi:hypothetical protein
MEPVRPGKHGTLLTLFVVGSALVFAFHARAVNLGTYFNRIFTSIAQACSIMNAERHCSCARGPCIRLDSPYAADYFLTAGILKPTRSTNSA